MSIIALSVASIITYFYWDSYRKSLDVEAILNLDDYYSHHVQPIFNGKCIACHSCYNSPCQLNLTSYEGLIRGASQVNLYDFPKVNPRSPTRLFIDAHSEKEWRKKGFFSVVEEKPSNLLLKMITEIPGIESGLQNKYDSEYDRVCIKSTAEDQMEAYLDKNPAGRMPLGFPALRSEDIKKITHWLSRGAKGPSSAKMEQKIQNNERLRFHLQKWENFFNGTSIKEKIVARYFYEHLFLAHLYFKSLPKVPFKLVRSKTKSGVIKEIGTAFPFSKPGQTFFYRLRPVINTLTHKVHVPFLLSDTRLRSWKKSLLDQEWVKTPTEMPPYGSEGSNPFETFKDIPRAARYKLFLENSVYFIMTFIKGPVCRGQTALNVINDHFWVFFLDPKYDVLVNSKEAYDRISEQIQFPAKLGGDFSPLVKFRDNYWKSVKTKFSFLKYSEPLNVNAIWSGDKLNRNANVTVFRHFDSATVLHGLRGRVPKTIWVLDYHVFESIYYNLSAGYNVFGPLLHQLNSRLYMEVSRVASEDLFLSFLPPKSRLFLRNSWNEPVPDQKESLMKSVVDLFTDDAKEKLKESLPFEAEQVKSRVAFKTKNPKNEFLTRLIQARFSEKQSMRKKYKNHKFSQLNKVSSKVAKHLPDAILVLTGTTDESKLWTIVHNKDHYNVAMLLFEDERRRPENDSIDVIEGAATSYANLIVDLRNKDVKKFTQSLMVLKNKNQVWKFLKKYGLSRSDKNFWKVYNDLLEKTFNPLTTERGYIDLNRYMNL